MGVIQQWAGGYQEAMLEEILSKAKVSTTKVRKGRNRGNLSDVWNSNGIDIDMGRMGNIRIESIGMEMGQGGRDEDD